MKTMSESSGMKFYEAIDEMDTNVECLMLTVCEGEFAGEKIIISAGEAAWLEKSDGFFSVHMEEAAAITGSGLTEIGGVRIYSETLGSEKEIIICGAGHVSMPVIRIAKMMNFRVTAIDDREAFVQNALANGADIGICKGFEEALTEIPGTKDSFFIIVTRGHRYDRECLLSIIGKPHAYIGMIGSRRKVGMVKKSLADAGVSQEIIDSVHTPIGLEIGAETPEEIAVSIMAEIIEVKNKKKRNFGFPRDIMNELLSVEREPLVMAVIVSKKGSSPRGVGARMLVKSDGSIIGTIGGGMAEAAAIKKALEMLSEGKSTRPYMMNIDMDGKAVEEEGMICGGAVELLMEVV
ncbi:MAG: XdhC family protein [Mogibacterium sp.]|nr:XdhC family protein [Mogibacterium sp.]